MKILFRILVIIIFTLSSNKSMCQNIEASRKKNSILISGASSIMLNGMYSFDYERNLYQKGKFETLLRLGYGEWYFIEHGVFSNIINGNSINTSINGLFGESSHKFEINLGIRYIFLEEWEKERISQYLPIFNIGYRYQNPFGKGLIFRAYVGDTGLGIAVGKAFQLSETASVFDRAEFFERFLKMVFMFSGLDWFALFERVLQLDTEFIETFGGDTFSLLDNE